MGLEREKNPLRLNNHCKWRIHGLFQVCRQGGISGLPPVQLDALRGIPTLPQQLGLEKTQSSHGYYLHYFPYF